MKPENCPRCEDFADDARKVPNERCVPDERHCSCVPHLRAELERLTAERNDARHEIEQLRRERAAERQRVDGRDQEIARLRTTIESNAEVFRLAIDQQNAENLLALDAVTKERDKARATAEELRLTLAAEQGRAEGAPNPDWQPSGGLLLHWSREYPDGTSGRSRKTEHGIVWTRLFLGCLSTDTIEGSRPEVLASDYAQTFRAAMLAADAATATHP